MTGMLRKLWSLPKTVYFNLRCFDLKTALKLPVLVDFRTRLVLLRRGVIRFSCVPSRFMVKIGFGAAREIESRRSRVCFSGGTVWFGGRADFGEGVQLSSSGILRFGDALYTNADCTFWCDSEITVGEDCRFGWGVTLRDSDGHVILENGAAKPYAKPISIGHHCWLCAESAVLKGGMLPDGSILAYRGVLTRAYTQTNTLYAGIPADPIKNGIDWPRGEGEELHAR